jgi:lipoyl(octanoyl) transferase
MDTWRLLETPPAHGAWNMAMDEAILEAVGRNESLPTLRLYAWDPACLSLGYAQPFTDVDIPRLRARGWDVVRRPTGGRAVLHIDELTYAVMAPVNEPRVAGSVLESYQRLAQALVGRCSPTRVPAIDRGLEPHPGRPGLSRRRLPHHCRQPPAQAGNYS